MNEDDLYEGEAQLALDLDLLDFDLGQACSVEDQETCESCQ